MRKRRVILTLAGFTAASSFLFAASGASVMLGAHIDTPGAPTAQADFQAFEASIGRPLAIDSDYEDWMPTSSPSGFPDLARIAWDKAAGRATMISWRTDFQSASPGAGCATAADIVAGKYDTQLAGQATSIAGVGVDVLVRWHYEMTDNDDDTCFNNGIPVANNEVLAGKNYIAAWTHIVDLFRAHGASNVRWVWAPSAGLFSNNKGGVDPTTWTYFYPGDSYVDWIACDNYNKTDTPESFAADPNIANFYAQTVTHGKPLMISETAANNDPALSPDPQTMWVTTIHAALSAMYPAIRAFVWWDEAGSDYLNTHPSYGGTGYQLVGPGLAAYKTLANDPYFGTSSALASGGPQLVSAASLQPGSNAPGSLVSIFGSGLASVSGGATVTVTDSAGIEQPATTLYVSPGQINAVLPAAMASGPVTFSVVPAGGVTTNGAFAATPVAPGIFSANANGMGVAAGEITVVHVDGSVTNDLVYTCPADSPCAPKPIVMGTGNTVYLILFGTGFRNRSSLANTSVSFNGTVVTLVYAGPQNEFAGLDQGNVAIPASLAGAGIVSVSVSADGVQSNTVTIEIQ